jgi:hypothetical protein
MNLNASLGIHELRPRLCLAYLGFAKQTYFLSFLAIHSPLQCFKRSWEKEWYCAVIYFYVYFVCGLEYLQNLQLMNLGFGPRTSHSSIAFCNLIESGRHQSPGPSSIISARLCVSHHHHWATISLKEISMCVSFLINITMVTDWILFFP